MKLGRKHLGRFLAVAVGGVLAGSAVACKQEASKSDDGGGSKAAPAGEKHACKGMNAYKGQNGCKTSDAGCNGKNSCKTKGGCATVEKHACKGLNACKGQGGCKPGDAGCAGKNSCKGKGGCAVPVKH